MLPLILTVVFRADLRLFVLLNIEPSCAAAQVVLLLVLTVLYWAYLRFFVPLNNVTDLVCEVLATACDAGTFVCGILLAVYNPAEIDKM